MTSSLLNRPAFKLALLAMGCVACEDLAPSDPPKGTGAPSQLSQSDFIKAFRKLACENLEKCCDSAGFDFDGGRCGELFEGAGQGAANSVFNRENAEKCLAEMAAAPSCGQKNNAPSCSLAYKGMLLPGDPCTQSLECAKPNRGDASCDPLRKICIVGVRGALYDECQQSCEQTRDGSVACVWGPASSWAAEGTIVTNCFANDDLLCGDTGQCLELGKTGESCSDDSSCRRELYCDVMRGYTCQPRRAIDQACVEFTQPCVASAYCGGGTCKPKKANGQACSSNAECVGACNCGVSGDCASSGFCTDPMDPVGNYIALLVLAGQCSATQ